MTLLFAVFIVYIIIHGGGRNILCCALGLPFHIHSMHLLRLETQVMIISSRLFVESLVAN